MHVRADGAHAVHDSGAEGYQSKDGKERQVTYMEFAERVRACIYAKNMTITEFARRAKIGETTVYAWFEGDNYPNTKTLMSAADVLGTHPNYLLGYDDDPVRPKRRKDK